MIILFTDFGADDIYVGQVKAALHAYDGAATTIDLLHSVPNYDVRAGAHLLAALQASFPAGSVFLAVVDPGVGSTREAVVVQADGKWYVGPDNGLLSVVAARAAAERTWRIVWRPSALSASFHGRDLFAPIAARIAAQALGDELEETAGLGVSFGPAELGEVIYTDHYGNVITGLLARNLADTDKLWAAGRLVDHARFFAEAPPGTAFWYRNSVGLVEIAVNRGSARDLLAMKVGDPVHRAGAC